MRKISLIAALLFISNSLAFSQNKISLNIGYGYYISNSENSLKIMENHKYKFFALYDLSYERDNLFGYDLMFEYSYQNIAKENAIKFVRSSDASPNPAGYIWGNIALVTHNLDFDYISNISNYFSFGIGPSFIIVNRIIDAENKMLYDKLASSGLGLNGFVQLNIPFSKRKNNIFFSSKLKFRYTHSIWFDKGIRNLDSYNQEFFTTQILAGLGYAF